MKTEVYCTLAIEGTHYWADCPHSEVDYLRMNHRHVFHIKAYKEVTHADRDTEFIMLKHRIESYIKRKYNNRCDDTHATGRFLCEFGGMSCEMIAEELISEFELSRCEVNEDNENGAIVTV